MHDNKSSAGVYSGGPYSVKSTSTNSRFSSKLVWHGRFLSSTWTKLSFIFTLQFPFQSSIVYLEATSHSSIWWWVCTTVALPATHAVTFTRKYYLLLSTNKRHERSMTASQRWTWESMLYNPARKEPSSRPKVGPIQIHTGPHNDPFNSQLSTERSKAVFGATITDKVKMELFSACKKLF